MTEGSTAPPSPSLHCQAFVIDGLTRESFYHLSPDAPPASGRPLVLFFHGDGSSCTLAVTGSVDIIGDAVGYYAIA